MTQTQSCCLIIKKKKPQSFPWGPVSSSSSSTAYFKFYLNQQIVHTCTRKQNTRKTQAALTKQCLINIMLLRDICCLITPQKDAFSQKMSDSILLKAMVPAFQASEFRKRICFLSSPFAIFFFKYQDWRGSISWAIQKIKHNNSHLFSSFFSKKDFF